MTVLPASPEGADEALPFRQDLAAHSIRVHHPDDRPTMTREPNSSMVPVHWPDAEIQRLLQRLAREIPLEAGGDRRTLRLANPGLPIGTTPTFWGSIQHILPGEVATAHRHAPNAFRFIISGEGASTTVDGERYPMNKGDVVLTPGGTWHEHDHQGDAPMTWLDCLDISLVASLHATYFQNYKNGKQLLLPVPDASQRMFGSGLMRPPGVRPQTLHSPVMLYSWDRAISALEALTATEADPFDDYVLEYINPMTGGPAIPTLSIALQWLTPGVRTKARRHTGSVLYHVVRGAGETLVQGRRFAWGAGDFLAIPPWAWYEHANRSAAHEAVLYQVTDRPTLTALGFYREEALSQNGGHQTVETDTVGTGTAETGSAALA